MHTNIFWKGVILKKKNEYDIIKTVSYSYWSSNKFKSVYFIYFLLTWKLLMFELLIDLNNFLKGVILKKKKLNTIVCN